MNGFHGRQVRFDGSVDGFPDQGDLARRFDLSQALDERANVGQIRQGGHLAQLRDLFRLEAILAAFRLRSEFGINLGKLPQRLE